MGVPMHWLHCILNLENILFGPAPIRTGTITLDPTFRRFTLLKLVSQLKLFVKLDIHGTGSSCLPNSHDGINNMLGKNNIVTQWGSKLKIPPQFHTNSVRAKFGYPSKTHFACISCERLELQRREMGGIYLCWNHILELQNIEK